MTFSSSSHTVKKLTYWALGSAIVVVLFSMYFDYQKMSASEVKKAFIKEYKISVSDCPLYPVDKEGCKPFFTSVSNEIRWSPVPKKDTKIYYVSLQFDLDAADKKTLFRQANSSLSDDDNRRQNFERIYKLNLVVPKITAKGIFISRILKSNANDVPELADLYHKSIGLIKEDFIMPLALKAFDTLEVRLILDEEEFKKGFTETPYFIHADGAVDFSVYQLKKLHFTKIFDLAILLVALALLFFALLKNEEKAIIILMPLVFLGFKLFFGGLAVGDGELFYKILYAGSGVLYALSFVVFAYSVPIQNKFTTRKSSAILLTIGFFIIVWTALFWGQEFSLASFLVVMDLSSYLGFLIVLVLGIKKLGSDYAGIPFSSVGAIKRLIFLHYGLLSVLTMLGAYVMTTDTLEKSANIDIDFSSLDHYLFYLTFMALVVNRVLLSIKLDDCVSEALININSVKTDILKIEKDSAHQDSYITAAGGILRRMFSDQTDIDVDIDYKTISKGATKQKSFKLDSSAEFSKLLSQVLGKYTLPDRESNDVIETTGRDVFLKISPDASNFYSFKFHLKKANPFYMSKEFLTAFKGIARMLESDITTFIQNEIESSFCPKFLQRLMGKSSVREIKIGDKAVFKAFMIKADMASWTNWRNDTISNSGQQEFDRLSDLYKALWEDEFRTASDAPEDMWRFRFDYKGDSYHAVISDRHDIYDFMKAHFERHERLVKHHGIPSLRAAVSYGTIEYKAEKGSSGLDFNFDGAPFVLSNRFEPVAKILGLSTLVCNADPDTKPPESLFCGRYLVQGYSEPLEAHSFYLEVSAREEASEISQAVKTIFMSSDKDETLAAADVLRTHTFSNKLTRGLVKYADFLVSQKGAQLLGSSRFFNFSGQNIEKDITDFEAYIERLLETLGRSS